MDFTWGLLNLKPGALERFHVIDLSAVQVEQAGLVDENLEALVVVGLVEHVRLVFESHGIAETRAAAADHRDPQTGRGRLLAMT